MGGCCESEDQSQLTLTW